MNIKHYNLSRIVWGAILVLCFALHSIGIWRIPFVDDLENRSYDMRLNYFKPDTVDSRIVIVDINEKSLDEQGRWPWGRDKLARMVDQLFDYYNVTVVGFDVSFIEEDVSSGINVLSDLAAGEFKSDPKFQAAFERIRPGLENDRMFAESLANRDTVLGFFFVSETNEANYVKGVLPAPANTASEIDAALPIPRAKGYTANLEILQNSAAGGGFIDKPLLDTDGVIRRVALLERHGDAVYASLPLAMVQTMMGGAPLQFNVVSDYERSNWKLGLESIEIGGLRIPVDARASMLVPYRGRQGSFIYVSATDVINGRVDKNLLENTVILVGSSAAGLLDLRSTPVQTEYPGVEVHANVLSGILDEKIMHQPDYVSGVELMTMIALGLILLSVLPLLSALWVTLFSTMMLVLLLVLNYYMWHQKLLLPLAPNVLLIALLFIQHITYGYFFEQKTKVRLHKSFGQYVPPELVEEMTQAGDSYTMEAQSREMTVLFSDVRGFTSISESMEPKQLADLMNEFLTPMTRIIHHSRGTIDKYMGDAIMAFWGAPLPDQNHAQHAVHAALQMVKTLPEINAVFKQRGWPEIKIGVGVNTGVMNVGNMGSSFRMAYTVMGDAVNLGSRLEGVTKKYGVAIIVSEFTKQQTPDVAFRSIDKVKVVGKDTAVEIFEPLCVRNELTTNQQHTLEQYHLALQQYHQQDWRAALKNLQDLLLHEPDCKLYKLYIERIHEFTAKPPGENWDGVYALSSK